MKIINRPAIVIAAIAIFAASFSYADDLGDIRAEVGKRHGEAVKRLQDWIALPSIAAENRNYPRARSTWRSSRSDAGFQQATVRRHRRQAGRLRHARRRRAKTVGLYFMYDVKQFDPAEWTSPPLEARIVDKPGLGKVDRRPRRGEPEGPGGGVPRRAARHPRRRQEDAGEPGAGRRGRGGDRLAAHRPDRAPRPRSKRRCARPSACSCRRRRRTSTASSPSASAPRASSSSSWSRAARSGAAVRRRTSTPSLKAMVDSPAWHLVKALDTLVSADGNTIAIDGYPTSRGRSPRTRRR